MLMKVFNKGQIVIPAEIRKELGIAIGDLLDVSIIKHKKSVIITKNDNPKSTSIAGSLAKYNPGNKVPNKEDMNNALTEGLVEGNNDNRY